MIGIGGISMSGIAQILLSYNCHITGYDLNESNITLYLDHPVYWYKNGQVREYPDTGVYIVPITSLRP